MGDISSIRTAEFQSLEETKAELQHWLTREGASVTRVAKAVHFLEKMALLLEPYPSSWNCGGQF